MSAYKPISLGMITGLLVVVLIALSKILHVLEMILSTLK